MWKLAPASNPNHIFSEGDKIRVRSGNHVSRELVLYRASNKKLCWREKGGSEIFYGWSRDSMTRGSMSEMGDFYGRTIDLWVEENNTVKPTPAATRELPPNSLVMVGKPFTKLVDGLRLLFRPYVGHGFQEFTAVVSRHTMVNNGSRPDVIQVHVQKNGVPYTTFSFVTNLDNLTVADLPMFEKFTCYLVKNYKKVTTVTQTKTSPAKPAQVVEEDDDGKYIIWCPTSDRAPQKILNGRKQAKAVAASMSEKHGKVFYWARLMGVAKQVNKEVVTVKQVTEIVTL